MTATMATKEHKVFSGYKVQVDAEQGIVEAIVAVMGSVDEGRDRIMPGAFSKTIQERASKVRVLDQHNADSVMRVLGKPTALREMTRAELPGELLQQYPDATGGLYARTQFFLDTPEGKGAFTRLAQGGLDEWSIGYDALDVDYTTEVKDGKTVRVRNLKTIRLWEVSPVLWGMQPATTTLSAKDREAGATKAEWSTAAINDLKDSAFAFIEPGGSKDDEGKTTPRNLRHFPHHTQDGTVDLPHVRNALARIPQSDVSQEGKDKATAHCEKHLADAKSEGKSVSPDGKEMVTYPNSTTVMEYPVQRLGDVLQGTIHRDFTRLTDTWYIQGYLSRDERIALSGAIGDALGAFNDLTPADVQMRQVYCAPEMDCMPGYFMSAVLDLNTKAGRVLSASNTADMTEAFAALGSALVNIQSIMKRAGLLEDPELEDPDSDEGEENSKDDSVDAKARRILSASQLARPMAEPEPSNGHSQKGSVNGVTTHQAVDESALLRLIELEEQSTDLQLEEISHGAGT